jgi:plastocyanin
MAHDEHGHEKEPIILTSGRRLGKGLLIVVITLAVGTAIIVPFFNEMYKNPPPVTQIRTERPPTTEPPAGAGTTTIAILQGASVQGNPDYDPDAAQVPLGNKIVWDNQDSIPHTATSGTGPSDPASADLFDTGIINGGEKSKAIELTDVSEGDVIDYYCIVHPYMTSQLTITAAGEGGQTGGTGGDVDSSPAAATINILEGASVQGSPDYEPDTITVKDGDEIHVVNQDTVPHTVTSGTGNSDPNKGTAFDTNIILGGDSVELVLTNVQAGEYDYFCIVHEYMKGKIIVE